MSSQLARHLGGRRFDAARAVFAGAHGLAIAVAGGLILLFLIFGRQAVLAAADGSAALAGMGHTYLAITVFFSPLIFVLSVHSDALRNEGRAGLMAAMSLLVSLANIGFDYVLIGLMGLGVAGSAYGTALAQALALAIVLGFRLRGGTPLRPGDLLRHNPAAGWARILALGAPQSLNFIGVGLVSAAIIAALQMAAAESYATTVAAYGIVTRLLTFAFLPLLGVSQAMQSIVGNNFGAGHWRRSDESLRLGLAVALVYCLVVEAALAGFARPLGLMFVDGADVAGEVGRILPVMVAMYFAAGPLLMVGAYFQAIGDAGRAAVLGLAKPYAFSIPLIFVLPQAFGEPGIWLAGPAAELLLLGLTAAILARTARRKGLRWGMFKAGV